MTPDDFNEKASEYVGATYIDAWNLVSPAMLLLHTVAEREKAHARTCYSPTCQTPHVAIIESIDRTEVKAFDTSLPRAVCRCVAAWLGWVEIEEENNGQP